MKKLQVCCCFVGLCLLGCSSKGETSAALEQAAQKSTEQRLERLEAQMATLDERVDTLGDTTYEVRTRSGKTTSMIVVPRGATATAAPKAAPAPVRKTTPAPARTATSPAHARVINPEALPAPFPRPQQAAAPAAAVAAKSAAAEKAAARPAPARQGASGSIGTPDRVAGPSGSISPDAAASAAPAGVQDLALPPSEAPVPDVSHLRSLEEDKVAPLTPVPPRVSAGQPAPAAPAVPDAGSAVPNIAVTPAAPAAPAAKAAPAPQKAAPAPRAAKGEKAAYEQALRTLNGGRTADGIAQFQSLLQQYPQGRYAANAHYWIGEGYYSQGKLQDALQQFKTVDQSFPRHHKTADALLKAGMTMSRLGDAQGAKQQYQQVIDRFPNSQAARRARGLIR